MQRLRANSATEYEQTRIRLANLCPCQRLLAHTIKMRLSTRTSYE